MASAPTTILQWMLVMDSRSNSRSSSAYALDALDCHGHCTATGQRAVRSHRHRPTTM